MDIGKKLLEHINNLYISNKDYPYRLFIITDYLINEYKNIFLTTYLESIWQKHFIILNLEILKKNKIIFNSNDNTNNQSVDISNLDFKF